jgi:GT2 family glycosyltransferase
MNYEEGARMNWLPPIANRSEEDWKKITLSISIVVHNDLHNLAGCLHSLKLFAPAAEIIITDNDSSDGTAAWLTKNYPSVRYLWNDKNEYFTKAHNRGMMASHGKYILVLNPDTIVRTVSIPQMIEYMDSHTHVGVLGPRIFNPDGSIQNSIGKFHTFKWTFYQLSLVNALLPNNRVNLRRHYDVKDVDHSVSVEAVSGACMMLRRSMLQEIGLFDQDFVIYSEEVDLCKRAQNAGWMRVYFPFADIVHFGSGTSRKKPRVLMERHERNSLLAYASKHFGFWHWMFLSLVDIIVWPAYSILLRLRNR